MQLQTKATIMMKCHFSIVLWFCL